MHRNEELCFEPDTLPFQMDNSSDDLVVIHLDQLRREHEERSFQRRKKLFEETWQFPYVPGPETQFSLDKPELYYSLDEILSGDYLTCEVIDRERQPLRLIADRNSGLAIIPAERSLLRPLHSMIVEVDHNQHEFTHRSLEIGAELAAHGLLVAFNGCNNSSYTNHWNCVDIRREFMPAWIPQIKIRNDFESLFTLEEAPGVYREIVSEGLLVTVVLSRDKTERNIKVGFVQHSLPFQYCPFTCRTGFPPFPYTFDIRGASREELDDLYLRMRLGIGYLEASTSNLVVKKIGEMSVYEHLEKYRTWTSPLKAFNV